MMTVVKGTQTRSLPRVMSTAVTRRELDYLWFLLGKQVACSAVRYGLEMSPYKERRVRTSLLKKRLVRQAASPLIDPSTGEMRQRVMFVRLTKTGERLAKSFGKDTAKQE